MLGFVASISALVALASARSGGDAQPVLLLLGTSAAAWLLARFARRWLSWLVPILLVAWAVGVGAARFGSLRSSLEGPLGYGNAKGQFFLLAAAAALTAAAGLRPIVLRVLLCLVALAFAAVVVASVSIASAALLVAAPSLAVAVSYLPRTWRLVLTSGVLVAALATTVALAETGLAGRFTQRRASLWSDAVDLVVDHPLTGVGPGRFALESPTARADIDAVWAHNGFLQAGAEYGAVALLLLLGLFVALLVDVTAPVRGPRGVEGFRSVLGTVVVLSFGLHACIDYLFHFPQVVVYFAALAGSLARIPVVPPAHPTPASWYPVQGYAAGPASSSR